MSKSLGPKHYISLFETEERLRAKIRAAVTDSGILPPGVHMSPGVENLFGILTACSRHAEAAALRKDYDAGVCQYSRLKDAVMDALLVLTRQFRERRAEMPAESAWHKVRQMSARAREIARATLRKVRQRIGLPSRD